MSSNLSRDNVSRGIGRMGDAKSRMGDAKSHNPLTLHIIRSNTLRIHVEYVRRRAQNAIHDNYKTSSSATDTFQTQRSSFARRGVMSCSVVCSMPYLYIYTYICIYMYIYIYIHIYSINIYSI